MLDNEVFFEFCCCWVELSGFMEKVGSGGGSSVFICTVGDWPGDAIFVFREK